MLWVGTGGHRSLLMGMVWIWVQSRRKMLGSARGALWEPRERCESVVGAWEQGNVRGAGMGAVGTKTIGNETKDE
jgi:hypothetical protein